MLHCAFLISLTDSAEQKLEHLPRRSGRSWKVIDFRAG